MEWIRGIAPSFEAAFSAPMLGASAVTREIVRTVAVLALLAVLAYCVRSAWIVLRQLELVTLAVIKHALDVVSVRDAILCVIGYRIGTELLRALVRVRRSA